MGIQGLGVSNAEKAVIKLKARTQGPSLSRERDLWPAALHSSQVLGFRSSVLAGGAVLLILWMDKKSNKVASLLGQACKDKGACDFNSKSQLRWRKSFRTKTEQ